jgi:O-antigen ligase
LNVGIVGLAAYLIFACAATAEVLRRCRIRPEAGIVFLAALIAFGFVHAFTEALFVSSSTLPFFAACGLLQVAFQPREIPDDSVTAATGGAPSAFPRSSLAGGAGA